MVILSVSNSHLETQQVEGIKPDRNCLNLLSRSKLRSILQNFASTSNKFSLHSKLWGIQPKNSNKENIRKVY